jgi:DNA polymerase IV
MNKPDPGSRSRRLLLADCDQFFVQCARLADPEGVGRCELLLVGGAAGHRGVVTSASYATREFGVRSGMPMSTALRLCPRATVAPVPRRLCSEKGRDVREVLRRFSPVVEAASIDESYIDMSGTEALYEAESLADTALRMQKAVSSDAGIVVSIGGGTSRIVAKLAAGRAKPAGVLIVEPGGEIDFMRRFDLAAIPGIGPVFARELQKFGLVSVEQALRLEPVVLEQWLGASRARWLHARIRGSDSGHVEPEREARSISREETFPVDLFENEDLETQLLELAVRLGADVRREGLRARTLTVKLRDADFRTRQASITIDEGVETDRAIYETARSLLNRLRSTRHTGARLIGIAASNLRDRAETQLGMFEELGAESDRDRRLSRVADAVRERFGPGAVRPGRLIDRSRRSGD